MPDEVTVDALGNLILFKKGTGSNKKKIYDVCTYG